MKTYWIVFLLTAVGAWKNSNADVAQIGVLTYPTLAAAVAAAQSNDTITLIGNAVLTQVLPIDIPLAIVSDGAVRTITRTNAFADDLIYVQAPGALTLGDVGGSDASPTLILDGGATNGIAGGFSFLFAVDADVVVHPGVVIRRFTGFYAPLYMLDTNGLATLTLNGGQFAHNTTTNSSGGAIASQGVDITLQNTAFLSNAAPRGRGGAIYMEDATLNADNISVRDNSADDYGGGIMCYPGTLVLNGGVVSGNSAINGGGVANGYGDLEIHGTVFTNNYANFGAAVWSHTGTNLIDSAVFRQNHSTDYGGAFNVISSGVTLTNSHLVGNTAGSNGGGLYVAPDSPRSLISIHSSVISSNSGLYGGAIYSSYANLSIVDSTLAYNVATGGGGGLWLFGDMAIHDSLIAHNTATEEGGGIFHLGGPLALSGQTRIEGNHTGLQGDGIWCFNGLYEGSNCVLTLSGGVSVAADNDIVLFTNVNTILLGGTLVAPGSVATITPPVYSNGLPLLRDAAGLSFSPVSRYYEKFAVAPPPASSTNWHIGTNGNLTFTAPPPAPVPPVELRDFLPPTVNPANSNLFQLAVDPLLLEYNFALQSADSVQTNAWNFQTLTNGYTVSSNGLVTVTLPSPAPLRIYRLQF